MIIESAEDISDAVANINMNEVVATLKQSKDVVFTPIGKHINVYQIVTTQF